jgi:RNA 3'-terminal phosphate cyclase (ATP)
VAAADSPLVIDGSFGEGGGQILRTTLSLAALLSRAVRIERARLYRDKPGLAAQHLTAVRATAAVCNARLRGDELGSTDLEFMPQHRPQAGHYSFDVGAARPGGSAGAAVLVLQTVLLPLAAATGDSAVTVTGGTHMHWSPTYDYAAGIWLPLLQRCGVDAELELGVSGWYPLGKGRIHARVHGSDIDMIGGLTPIDAVERGRLLRVQGRALTANLPSHIAERMAAHARLRLDGLGVPLDIAPDVTGNAACAGACLFLQADYEHTRAGFNVLGKRGKPSEQVADEAADALLAQYRSGAALDAHLADQALLPLALASGPSIFTTETVSRHLQTNAWVIEQFGLARIHWRQQNGAGLVEVKPLKQAGPSAR